MSVATGVVEKSISVFYELRRPEERRHGPAMANASRQVKDGLDWLEARVAGTWMWGETMTQLDVSTVCFREFIRIATPDLFATLDCPRIADIAARAGELEAFRKTVPVA